MIDTGMARHKNTQVKFIPEPQFRLRSSRQFQLMVVKAGVNGKEDLCYVKET